jgi:hypothetical protein
VIDADLSAFLQSTVMIDVASCGPNLMPATARAFGCRVADERSTLRLLVAPSQAAAVLAQVQEGSALAAVFSDPASGHTVQLKGRSAEACAPDSVDRATLARYRAQFVPHWRELGFDPALARALLACAPDDLAVLVMTPDRAHAQTPGPNAGAPLMVHP